MADNIIETMKQIRAENRGGGRPNYPEHVRRAAMQHWLGERAGGRSAIEVAAELGVHQVSLNVWRRKYDRAKLAVATKTRALPAIREVVIAERMPTSPKSAFVVHAACAVRIEGMSVAQAIELVRGLR